jgi:hypothetical protein
MNVYDAVLAEASDLWQAASDAQQLGRLKMASSYLLLLHARLVGLGKRFDKAQRPVPAVATTPAAEALGLESPAKKRKASPVATVPTTLLTPRTARTLSEMLPGDIQLDQAMMEHLAKAAAELHSHRSGKARPLPEWNGGKAQTYVHQQQHVPTAKDAPKNLSATKTSNSTKGDTISVLWTEHEIQILTQALDEARQTEPPNAHTPFDPALSLTMALAKQLSRNPMHVRAFLRNQIAKSRIATHLALDQADHDNHGGGSSSANSETPQRKGGGRGPKPPPAPVHTVPHAECNAKLLLQGYFLEGGQAEDEDNNEGTEEGTDGETDEGAAPKDEAKEEKEAAAKTD